MSFDEIYASNQRSVGGKKKRGARKRKTHTTGSTAKITNPGKSRVRHLTRSKRGFSKTPTRS